MATRESIEMPKSISRMLAGVKLASKQWKVLKST
jgi:hypothetical protein